MPPPLISTARLAEVRKTYLVGVDGSELSFRALRLTAALADDMKDNVVVVHVGEPKDETHLQSKCFDILLKRGVQPRRQAFHLYTRDQVGPGFDIADLLIFLACATADPNPHHRAVC